MTGPKLNEGALRRRRAQPAPRPPPCTSASRPEGPRGARPDPRPRRAARRRGAAVHRPRASPHDIRKVLASAVANAVHNDEQDADELFVMACFADEGPTLKRFRPRARGRASRIRKRTCHITIVVARIERRPPRGRPGPPRPQRTAAGRRRRSAQPPRPRRQPPGPRRAQPRSAPPRRARPATVERRSRTSDERAADGRRRSLERRRPAPRASRSRATPTRCCTDAARHAEFDDRTIAEVVVRHRRGRRSRRLRAPDRGNDDVDADHDAGQPYDEHARPRRRRHRRARRGRRAQRAEPQQDDEERQLMGQKINPYGFRLGITTDWKSRWFCEREYKDYLTEDWKIREAIMTKLESAAISRIEIERTRDKVRVDVHTARPGIVIGRRGAQADELRALITKITGNPKVQLNIVEIKSPELDAALDRPGRRRPARQPHRLPPGDEARRAERPAGRCPRHPGAVLGPPRRRRDEPHRVVPRGPRAAAHAARRHRLRLPRGPHLERPRRRQGVALQGRHPPLQVASTTTRSPARRRWPSARRPVRPAEPRRVVSSAARRRGRGRAEADAAAQGSRSRAGEAARRRRGDRPPHPRRLTRRRTSVGRTEPSC